MSDHDESRINGRRCAQNPKNSINFPLAKKVFIVAIGFIVVFNSNLGSSLPSGAVDDIAQHFSITENMQLILLNSLYLVGYTVGPLIFGPMSEHLGRRPVLISAHIGYMLCTMACALSPKYSVLLLFRGLAGLVAAAPNAVVGGLIADVFNDARQRGIAMAGFIAVALTGPAIGPMISGYTVSVSWRLCFWVGMAIAGVSLPFVMCLPETYRVVLEKREDSTESATHMGPNGPHSVFATADLQVVFTRPVVMLYREPIVLCTSLYLSLVYSILYLFFQAYPIIFQEVYMLSTEEIGLAFLPVAGGSMLALLQFLLFDRVWARAKSNKATWASKDKYSRLPLACVGGAAITICLFWLGWTSYSSINPAIPIMSGLAFGMGYFFVFFAMLSYLTDAYKHFSASAHSAASTTRSLTAVCLPFAAPSMYSNLGLQWACSLLGFCALVMSAIPLIFLKYDKEIRRRSSFCQQIHAMHEEERES